MIIVWTPGDSGTLVLLVIGGTAYAILAFATRKR
jgi:hypothetical protein